MNQVLKYPGAKNRVAKWIVSYMPKHDVYLELFSGSAAVLLNKERSHIETINDLDSDVVNFFQVIRDFPEKFSEAVLFTPFARDEYKAAFNETESRIEKARRYCVKCWQGFGNSQLYQNGFKSGQQGRSPNPAAVWAKLPQTIIEVAERLKGVQIENLPALEMLKRYNTADVFVYADPPYLESIRKKHLYKHEMGKESEHIELLEKLLQHPGFVMISGYDNEIYDYYLKDWNKVYKETQVEGGGKKN